METKIKALRKERGVSAFQLSRDTGVHPSAWSRIENRKMVPNNRDRALILAAFGVDGNELFDGDTGLAAKV